MLKLYFLSGSRHSEEAAELLASRKLDFEMIDLSDRGLLAAAFRDFGIRELPTLAYKNIRYEGLKQIRDFLSSKGI